jgi:hypothetical protein
MTRPKTRVATASLTLLVALLALGACQQPADAEAGGPVKSTADAEAGSAPYLSKPGAAPTGAEAREVSEENDLYSFDYAYPAAAAALPGVRAILEEDLKTRKAELVTQATEERDMAKESGFPYRSHYLSVGWDVVTEIPGWLSLSAGIETYTGGAHGNHGFDALLWDKKAGKMRDVGELFTSDAALRDAIQPAFCKALDKERAKRREGYGGDNFGFDECIDPLESTVILGSSSKKAFDRIGILVPPYAAGPYVEGSYEVTVPVTQAVLAAVKPEYKASFAGR